MLERFEDMIHRCYNSKLCCRITKDETNKFTIYRKFKNNRFIPTHDFKKTCMKQLVHGNFYLHTFRSENNLKF